MQEAALTADRAVTFGGFDLRGRFDLELNKTAMAAAFMFDQSACHVCLELLQSGWSFQAFVRGQNRDASNNSHPLS